jgi:hypothetical protein
MILPQTNLWTTQKDVLTRLGRKMFLADLNLADLGRVLNDFTDVRFMCPTDLSKKTFGKVEYAADEPVLPKDADAGTKWWGIGFDHAECTVETPGEEEDEHEMVRVPEPLIVFATGFLEGCEGHGHETDEHHVASRAGTGAKIDEKKSFDARFRVNCEAGKVDPVSDCMDPGKEHD